MPIISFIIPTHNRAKYALLAIERLLLLKGDIEIVVADTSTIDEDILPAFIAKNPNMNLKLIKPEKGISVVENFNIGLNAATGEYLVFIGDDDSVSQPIIEVAEWIKKTDVDSLQFTFPVIYYWPDFRHKTLGDSLAGTLHIGKFSGLVHSHNAKKALLSALDDFGGGVGNMPRAYSGMLSKQLALHIVKKYGSLFGGVSPDIYSSALIAMEAKHCLRIDYPLVIPGSSGASTAGHSANGKHVGVLRENAHIGSFKNLIWDIRIPEFYSVPTVWGYSLLRAVEKKKSNEFKPNYARVLVKCFIYYPSYFVHTWASFKYFFKNEKIISACYQLIFALTKEIRWIFSKIVHRFFSKKDSVKVLNNLMDIKIAMQQLDEYLIKSSKKIYFREIE